ncbi:MAG: glutamate-5-semialdehyde dehydrogenase [Chloroflexi bacterium]|nr:glutamate-5-semialdehyde dehydrogenase [Chloroflexota bacterium]
MSEVNLVQMGQTARRAARSLGLLSTAARNALLEEIAQRLESAGDELWQANQADVAEAREAGVAPALIDRSTLTPKRLAGMIQGCRDVAALPDPLGELFDGKTLPNGMRIAKKRVPLGVVAVIFESRPNVTIDISALCLKTGNAVIMRGGRESLRTNRVLAEMVRAACQAQGAPADAVQLITSTDRALVPQLLKMDEYIDMVIPRGGTGLQNLVKEHAKMPVIYGGIGVCHLFVDESADLARSLPVIHNAKTQAPSVCNALDTVLVHRAVAVEFIPQMVRDLQRDGVKIYLDEPSLATLEGAEGIDRGLIAPAGPDAYGQEFLSLTLSVKVVDSLDEAIEFIGRYGTNHSDGILTNNYQHAMRFLDEIDSACVYVNASTRFTDGGQFGLGAEVAISTQRLHARGPMALEALTTYKWIVQGDYHVRV